MDLTGSDVEWVLRIKALTREPLGGLTHFDSPLDTKQAVVWGYGLP